jgi:hypothetical protein
MVASDKPDPHRTVIEPKAHPPTPPPAETCQRCKDAIEAGTGRQLVREEERIDLCGECYAGWADRSMEVADEYHPGTCPPEVMERALEGFLAKE